ncbi:ribosome maturation factor RimM [Woodsholea maritima]|uniref:ribosome maturation factor RimM n=1 Tax=Woodsholea maritima TaxID=240237 RepID=UPI0003606D19|nr:ribosome maturation factor RimM [Woodsholea maritima]
MSASDTFILVGAIAGAHGVKGEVKIKSFTADPDAVFDYGPFLNKTGAPLFTVKSHKSTNDGFIARIAEVKSREEAQALKGTQLFVPREVFPDLEEDEFYYTDLYGLKVEDLEGNPLGEVKAVFDYGAGDLLELHKTPDRKGSWLLAFTREAVPHIDIKAGKIIANPPQEGNETQAEEEAGRKAFLEGDTPEDDLQT